jgi:hypothetical protein
MEKIMNESQIKSKEKKTLNRKSIWLVEEQEPPFTHILSLRTTQNTNTQVQMAQVFKNGEDART